MQGVLPLLGQLYKLATDEQIPPAVRLAAIKDWLDRAGLNAKTTIELDLPWQQLLLSGITATVDEATAEVREFYNPDDTTPTVIEGEAWEVSDKDYSDGVPRGHVEKVTYPPAPQHDPQYPPEPRAGQPPTSSDRPRVGRTRRG